MPSTRVLIVIATVVVMLAGAVILGAFMPTEFLGGINRPIAVTLLGMAPVLVVVVGVGCVLTYRWAVKVVFTNRSGKRRSPRGRPR